MSPMTKRSAFFGRLANRADDLAGDRVGRLALLAILIVAGLLRSATEMPGRHPWDWLTTVPAPAYDNIAGFDHDVTRG